MIKTGIELVDVTKADTFLSKNYSRNRPLSMPHARYFARTQERGEFLAGSPIRFVRLGEEEVMVDGQHRVMAVKLSGIPALFSVTVVDGDPARDYALVDSVIKRRTPQDQLRALGTMADVELPRSVADRYLGALRIIEDNFSISNREPLALEQMGDLSGEFKKEMMRFLEITKDASARSVQNALKSTVLAVALVTLKHADPTASESFWSQVVLDDGLKTGDPRKRLHYDIMPSGRSDRETRQRALLSAIVCWNLYASNQPVPERLRLPKTVPHILETPYPWDDEQAPLDI